MALIGGIVCFGIVENTGIVVDRTPSTGQCWRTAHFCGVSLVQQNSQRVTVLVTAGSSGRKKIRNRWEKSFVNSEKPEIVSHKRHGQPMPDKSLNGAAKDWANALGTVLPYGQLQ